MNITEMNFTCQREHFTIRGIQFVPTPEAGKKYPAIIFSHGFTGNYLNMVDYCRDFAAMGYVTLCFNFCGGGSIYDNDGLQSDGNTTDMTVFTEVADLTAVMNYALGLPFVDEKQIILAGVSQGGFVSGLTAAAHKDIVSKLIMIFPALCIPDHARRGCLGGADYNLSNVPEEIHCGKSILSRKMHDEMVGFDPYLALSAYKGPVLLLQGMEDSIVNYSYAIRAMENYEKGQCRLQLIRNMGHGMNQEQYMSTVASIRQFLNDRKEILTIRVIITHIEHTEEGNLRKSKLFFTGYCESPYFQGAILPGACDAQEHRNQILTKIRAEYTLDGLDMKGEHCYIHIVNQPGEADWCPVIDTDSKALSWLKDAKLTAVLEHGDGGPTVRIFAEQEIIP